MKRVQLTLWVAVAALCYTNLPASAASSFERANDLYAKGQFHQAIDAYIDAICQQPRYYPAHYQLANAYMKVGKFADAETEYEMCLEMYPDAKTKAHCKKALNFLTGTATGRAAVRDDGGGESGLDQRLAIEGERRAQKAALDAERQRKAIESAGEAHAKHIKEAAKAQLEEIKLNSNCWVMDGEKNDRVPMIYPEVEYQVLTRAQAQADKAIEAAKSKAQKVSGEGATSTTDGLRSQIYQQGNSNIRLSPVGTGVHVRNYQTIGKKVASNSDSVK